MRFYQPILRYWILIESESSSPNVHRKWLFLCSFLAFVSDGRITSGHGHKYFRRHVFLIYAFLSEAIWNASLWPKQRLLVGVKKRRIFMKASNFLTDSITLSISTDRENFFKSNTPEAFNVGGLVPEFLLPWFHQLTFGSNFRIYWNEIASWIVVWGTHSNRKCERIFKLKIVDWKFGFVISSKSGKSMMAIRRNSVNTRRENW